MAECETLEMRMSDGNVNTVYVWQAKETRCCLVLSHGMCEWALRYEPLAIFLAEAGVTTVAEDHRGHGKTALAAQKAGTGELSFLADKDGFNRVVQDVCELIAYTKTRFSGKPVFLFGHSFGSLVAQSVIETHGDMVDKAVLCGTIGPRRALIAAANVVGSLVKALEGAHRKSALLYFLTFGFNNAHIKGAKTPFDWLSRDEAAARAYADDLLCGVQPTNGFLCDIYCGLRQIHRRAAIASIPKSLPVLIIAGTDDPIGSRGKTVRRLLAEYQRAGMTRVTMKLYEGARHELLNETNRDEVMADVRSFLLEPQQTLPDGGERRGSLEVETRLDI